MNKQAVINALVELAPLVRPTPNLQYFKPESGTYRHYDNQHIDSSPAIKRLAAVLREDPLLQQGMLEDTSLQTSPESWTGGSGEYFLPVAHWLLAQSRHRHPEEVVDQLEQFVTTNSTQMLEVMALWGVHPSRSIDVYQGIKLVPMSSLPPSPLKDQVAGVGFRRFASDTGLAPSPVATAALVREFEHGPVFASGRVQTHAESEAIRVNDRTELMLEIARCLILATESPISPIHHWYQVDETVPLIGGAHGGKGWAIEHIQQFGAEPRDLDEDWVKSIVNSYFRLDNKRRERLHVPLTRLNQAMLLSKSVNDIAIDLGIAMEALLTEDLESNAPIAYHVRLRGTLLLGGDPETRKQNYYRLKELYSLRSTAVHSGNLAESTRVRLGPKGYPRRQVDTREFLGEGVRMCAEMIRVIIHRAEDPDWDALVVGW